jgi:hypothetical protein
MADDEIHVGDIGTVLELALTETIAGIATAVDISAATVKDITLRRPDLTTVTRAGVFVTDGTDGLITITTISGDLSMDGCYSLQVYLELASWDGYSNIGEFIAHVNLV